MILNMGRLTGIYGKGNTPAATLTLSTFDGMIRLRKGSARR